MGSEMCIRDRLYCPFGHTPSLGKSAKEKADRVIELLEGDLFGPRDWEICLVDVERESKKLRSQLEDYLFGLQKVVKISDKLATTPQVLERARELLSSEMQDVFSASEARQCLNTSRKCIIPILEWMDRQGWTVRMGDGRMFQKRSELEL